LLVFNYYDSLLFKVVVVGRGFVDDSLDNVWEVMEPFEKHVHQLAAPDGVACFPRQHFEIADVLVNVREVEGKSVEACLGDLLFRGVGELQLEALQEVEVCVFDIVINGMELLEAFQYALDPPIDLWSFDKCECNCDASYWRFESGYPLVGHHVDPEFPDEGVCVSSVTIKDEWGNARRF